MPVLPAAFLQLQSFVRNDVRSIRSLDKEQAPVYAVGLLIAIATEALSGLENREDHSVFAEDLMGRRRGVPPEIGRVLFDVVRHGLARDYDTRTVVLGSEEVVVVLSWELRAYLSVATEDWLLDGNLPRGICLNMGTLWSDLDAHFIEFSAHLERDAELRRRVAENAAKRKRSKSCTSRLAPVPRGADARAESLIIIQPICPTLAPLLTDLYAFHLDHRHCGELEAGSDEAAVWRVRRADRSTGDQGGGAMMRLTCPRL